MIPVSACSAYLCVSTILCIRILYQESQSRNFAINYVGTGTTVLRSVLGVDTCGSQQLCNAHFANVIVYYIIYISYKPTVTPLDVGLCLTDTQI